MDFLKEILTRVQEEGWTIRNIDGTLLAQQPKLSPYMQEMQKNIAASLGLDDGQVNIKATTTEGLNAEGRGEGISAHAVALLFR
jgi:2-C-methyl-D-erythritol 2,4-cyclodiphosphate synthase